MDYLNRYRKENNFGTLEDQFKKAGVGAQQKRPYNFETDSVKEIERLEALKAKGVVDYHTDDFEGMVRYAITINTAQGERNVYWTPATNEWKPVKGAAGNYGIYTMARYYQIIEKGEKL